MPFTVSPSSYYGPQLIMQGAQNLSEGLVKGMEEWRKAQQEQAGNDIIIDYAMKNNLLSPEEHTKFIQGNSNVKSGIVAGLVRSFALDVQRQQMEGLKEQREAMAETRLAQAEARRRGAELGGKPIYTEPPVVTTEQDPYGGLFKITKTTQAGAPVGMWGFGGEPHFFPGGRAMEDLGQPQITDTDPVTGEKLPVKIVTYG